MDWWRVFMVSFIQAALFVLAILICAFVIKIAIPVIIVMAVIFAVFWIIYTLKQAFPDFWLSRWIDKVTNWIWVKILGIFFKEDAQAVKMTFDTLNDLEKQMNQEEGFNIDLDGVFDEDDVKRYQDEKTNTKKHDYDPNDVSTYEIDMTKK